MPFVELLIFITGLLLGLHIGFIIWITSKILKIKEEDKNEK